MPGFLNKDYPNSFWVKVIFLCVCILCVFGLISIYSVTSASNVSLGISTYHDAIMQGVYILAGFLVVFLLSRFQPVSELADLFIFGFLGICFCLVLLVAIGGTEVNGAKRWLYIGSFSMQPSEFLKIALMLALVRILVQYNRGERDRSETIMWFAIAIVLPLLVLFVTQRDLGTTLICVGALFCIAYIAGVNLTLLGGIFILGVVLLLAYLMLGSDYRNGRMVFLNPWNDGEDGYGSGYNLIRAFYAISSGGLFGVGIGNSHEKYDYLYAADNDFVFAIICEETGLIGGLIVIACVVLIFISCLKIAQNTTDQEQCLILYGCAFLLLFQSALNIGCSVGALPTTGKPLPFVSSGGSAVFASFLIFGLIVNTALSSVSERSYERKRDKIEILSKPKGGNRGLGAERKRGFSSSFSSASRRSETDVKNRRSSRDSLDLELVSSKKSDSRQDRYSSYRNVR